MTQVPVSLLSASPQDRREHLAAALEQAMQTCPRDMEQERAMLVFTMLLARKVADHTPSLLRDVFRTAVNFINQNLLTYVRNLVRNVSTVLSSLAFPALLVVSACSPPFSRLSSPSERCESPPCQGQRLGLAFWARRLCGRRWS